MLIPFGALTIDEFIELFTLWEEDFYWILLAPGCISFGGRIPIASIQEILEYILSKRRRRWPISLDCTSEYINDED